MHVGNGRGDSQAGAGGGTPVAFADRAHAGRFLAGKLRAYENRGDVLVLALPRGGVPVGYEVARGLNVPLDVFLVRKLGVPWHPELAMGAIATGGVRVLNPSVVRELGITDADIDAVAAREQRELERREAMYRGSGPAPQVAGRIIILIDDGLATGSTMRAAVEAIRLQHPAKVVVAVPVASADVCEAISREADEVVCARAPKPFIAVGLWYEDFTATTDQEVQTLLERATSRAEHRAA